MTTLEFRSIRKTFGATVALESLDLAVHEGELITLLGPSGCGKTTALRVAAGFEYADRGAVIVGGSDLTDVPAHQRNMGMVFQSYSLFPNLTVAQNVEFGLRTRKVAKTDRSRRVNDILDLVELGSLTHRYPHQLSGGQQQRVALARALAIQPRVLLLDEPLSALDAKVRTALRDEIRRIQRELGITTLFVTHDQEEALAISDRVCVMSNGMVEQCASPLVVYRTPATAFVARFVGAMNEIPATYAGLGAVTVAGRRIAAPNADRATGSTTLLVRPEDIAFVGLDTDGLVGSVTSVTFQGATSEVAVRLDVLDRIVRVAAAPQQADALVAGTRVAVVINGTRAMFDRE